MRRIKHATQRNTRRGEKGAVASRQWHGVEGGVAAGRRGKMFNFFALFLAFADCALIGRAKVKRNFVDSTAIVGKTLRETIKILFQ